MIRVLILLLLMLGLAFSSAHPRQGLPGGDVFQAAVLDSVCGAPPAADPRSGKGCPACILQLGGPLPGRVTGAMGTQPDLLAQVDFDDIGAPALTRAAITLPPSRGPPLASA
ncbi:MAG: hypothetical protein WBP18_07655 [Paracoccaceae bacterium]